jgi:hypothetical protein
MKNGGQNEEGEYVGGWVGVGGVGDTLPCPGGPKSHITDENPIAEICVESQWGDFELLKCCAALSEWMKSRRSIWA